MIDEKKIEKAAEEWADGAFEDQAVLAELSFKEGINWYRNEVWHDATIDAEPKGVSGNRGVLVVGIRKGRVSYKYLWTDWEGCYNDLELLVDQVPTWYSHALWAYIRDLVPIFSEDKL